MTKKKPDRTSKSAVPAPRPFSAGAMGDDAKFKGTTADNLNYRGDKWNDIPGITPIPRKK